MSKILVRHSRRSTALISYLLRLRPSTLVMSAPPEPSSQSPPAQPPPPAPTQHTGSPTDFLKGVVGKRVIVRLISGVDYQGMSHHFVSILSTAFVLGFMAKIIINRDRIAHEVVCFLPLRNIVMLGRFHEYRVGANRRACKRSYHKSIR